jgi:hypothetical protein
MVRKVRKGRESRPCNTECGLNLRNTIKKEMLLSVPGSLEDPVEKDGILY